MSAPLFRRWLTTISAAAVVAAVSGAAVLHPAAARGGERDGGCSKESLRGDYGILVQGVRGPGAPPEAFVGTAFHSYDGAGNFTGVDNTQGERTSSVDRKVTGTYEVGDDCSGTAEMTFPDITPPVFIRSNFIIVHHGSEIVETVFFPPGNRVTAIQHRIR